MDYPTYLQQGDKSLADAIITLYKARHEKDRAVVGNAGYYAVRLLW